MYELKSGTSFSKNAFNNPAVASNPAIILKGATRYFFSKYGSNSVPINSKNIAPFLTGKPLAGSNSESL